MKLDNTDQYVSSEVQESASEELETSEQVDNASSETEVSDVNESESGAEEESNSNGDPDPEEEAEAEGEDNDDGDDDGDDDDDDEDEDEEDPEDPADALKESCTKSASCKPLLKSFDACEERVNSKSKTEETCLEEYIDFIKCRDKCVSRDLFSKLK